MSTAKTWYANPRAKFSEKQQVEPMQADGMTDGRLWIKGRRGQDLDNALAAARDRILRCTHGMRALGGSRQEIDKAMDYIESKGGIVLDYLTGMRSDRASDARKMYAAALSAINQEQRGLSKAKSRKGGHALAKERELDQLDVETFRGIWFDLKRFATDQDACDFANKLKVPEKFDGWNPQMARRRKDPPDNLGPSGRPRGNRAWQPAPKVVTKRKRK